LGAREAAAPIRPAAAALIGVESAMAGPYPRAPAPTRAGVPTRARDVPASAEGDAAAVVQPLEELPEGAGQVGAGVGAQCGGALGEPGGAGDLGGPGAADPAAEVLLGAQVVAGVAEQPPAVPVFLAGGRGWWGGQVFPPGGSSRARQASQTGVAASSR
jgi:hypothetical protein